jgi:hypothetical protein
MDIVKSARELTKSEMEKYDCPLMPLFDFAAEKTIELAKKMGVSEEIVGTGFWLMDVKLPQARKEKKAAEHTRMSLERAREFLASSGLDEDAKEKILSCVADHHGAKEYRCLEAEVSANGDCYKFMHPKGFFMYLTILGRECDTFEECLKQAEMKMNEKFGVISLDICKQELGEYYRVLKGYIAEAGK